MGTHDISSMLTFHYSSKCRNFDAFWTAAVTILRGLKSNARDGGTGGVEGTAYPPNFRKESSVFFSEAKGLRE